MPYKIGRILLALLCVPLEASSQEGASVRAVPSSVSAWTTQALAVTSTQHIQDLLERPKVKARLSQRNHMLLKPEAWLDARARGEPSSGRFLERYLREGRVLEIALDKDRQPMAWRVNGAGKRTRQRVDLHTFFFNSDIEYLTLQLQALEQKKSPWAVRILLGIGPEVYETAEAIWIGESLLQFDGIPLKFFRKRPPARGIVDHSPRVEAQFKYDKSWHEWNRQDRRYQGRAEEVPMLFGIRPQKIGADPQQPAMVRYRLEATSGETSFIAGLASRQPALGALLGVEQGRDASGEYFFEYYSSQAFVELVENLVGLHGRFWLGIGDGEAGMEELARRWDEEAASPLQELGYSHFHDIGSHMAGYLAIFLLEESVSLSRAHTRFIRTLLRWDGIRQKRALRRRLVKMRDDILGNLDSMSNILNTIVRSGEVDDRFDRVLDRLRHITTEGLTVPQLAKFLFRQSRSWTPALRTRARRLAATFGAIPGRSEADLLADTQRIVEEARRGLPSLVNRNPAHRLGAAA